MFYIPASAELELLPLQLPPLHGDVGGEASGVGEVLPDILHTSILPLGGHLQRNKCHGIYQLTSLRFLNFNLEKISFWYQV